MMARLEKCGLQSISHSRRNKGRNRRQATEEEILEGNGQKSIISSLFLASLRSPNFLTNKKAIQNTLEKKCKNS